MILAYVLLFIAGLALLLKGSNYVAVYASKLAEHCGLSGFVIGITVVAMSTSLPELSVSLVSIIFKTSQIATGVIVGSNIANICLVVGIAAALYPMKTKREFVHEGFFTLLFTLVAVLFLLDGMVWYEGALILGGAIVYMYQLIRTKKRKGEISKAIQSMERELEERKKKTVKYLLYCIAGGVVVVLGAEILIYSTINMAHLLGVSEFLIAIIAIAIGTSLPELAVSFTAAFKKMRGISLGNILGSNVFNLAILGLVSLFSAVPVTNFLVAIDLPIMLLSAVLLLLFIRAGMRITRIEGLVLLLAYVIFLLLHLT